MLVAVVWCKWWLQPARKTIEQPWVACLLADAELFSKKILPYPRVRRRGAVMRPLNQSESFFITNITNIPRSAVRMVPIGITRRHTSLPRTSSFARKRRASPAAYAPPSDTEGDLHVSGRCKGKIPLSPQQDFVILLLYVRRLVVFDRLKSHSSIWPTCPVWHQMYVVGFKIWNIFVVYCCDCNNEQGTVVEDYG
jgi:hypothetical protein